MAIIFSFVLTFAFCAPVIFKALKIALPVLLSTNPKRKFSLACAEQRGTIPRAFMAFKTAVEGGAASVLALSCYCGIVCICGLVGDGERKVSVFSLSPSAGDMLSADAVALACMPQSRFEYMFGFSTVFGYFLYPNGEEPEASTF